MKEQLNKLKSIGFSIETDLDIIIFSYEKKNNYSVQEMKYIENYSKFIEEIKIHFETFTEIYKNYNLPIILKVIEENRKKYDKENDEQLSKLFDSFDKDLKSYFVEQNLRERHKFILFKSCLKKYCIDIYSKEEANWDIKDDEFVMYERLQGVVCGAINNKIDMYEFPDFGKNLKCSDEKSDQKIKDILKIFHCKQMIKKIMQENKYSPIEIFNARGDSITDTCSNYISIKLGKYIETNYSYLERTKLKLMAQEVLENIYIILTRN